MPYRLCADFVALLHAAIVLYILLGVPLILFGLWRGWAWVRQPWFRISHLLLSLAVIGFEWAGQPCPLTTLERNLRAAEGGTYEGSFIQHYVSEAIHLQLTPQQLALPTSLWVALIVGLFIWRGPRRSERAQTGGERREDLGGRT